MKKILVILIIHFVCFYGFSQTVKVVDKTNWQGLPAVNISTNNSEKIITTNSKGEADISELKNSDSIHFSIIGYQKIFLSYAQIEKMKFVVPLSEKTYFLDEIVVSASRFEEKKEDVPQQIQVLKSRDLKFMNQQTTADVLQQSGNVLVQKSQAGGGSPIIRGFEANKVLLVVDGVRMNNAIYRSGHLQNVLTIDNSIIDKTEIVFGPGSVVYGSDALGGVMNFYTKSPLLSDSGMNTQVNAFTRFSSANMEKTAHADFNLGFEKIAFLTSFTYSDFGDLKSGKKSDDIYDKNFKRKFFVERINEKDSIFSNENPEIQKPSGYSQYDILQKILFQQNEKISQVLNFQYSNSSEIPRYDRLTEISNGKPKFSEWYYGPQKRMFGSYTLNIKTDSSFADNIRIIAAFQNIAESRHNRRFSKQIRNSRIEKLNIFTLNSDFDKKFSRQEFRCGTEITFNNVNSSAFAQNIISGEKFTLDTRYPDGGSTMKTAAIYITHTFEVSPKIILSDGARYSFVALNSKFSDKTFFPFPFDEVSQQNNALNGNLGLIFMPSKYWRFSVLGSTGFRAPNVDDLSKIFESIPGKVIVPNPHLKPEKTYNAELSVLKIFNNIFQIEGIGFYTLYKDAITTSKAAFNGQDSILYNGVLSEVISNSNKKQAFIYGTSFNVAADFTNSISFTSSVNYTYGRIKTDSVHSPLDHIPPVFGKTGINLKLNKFRTEFFMLYNGWKKKKDYNLFGEDNFAYATPRGMTPWQTLNFRTSYHFTKNIQLQFACENILDTHYRVFASGISGAGRNFMITLRGNF